MDIDEYLKGILGQILDSYKILVELDDTPNDLDIIKKETAKIKGLLQVIHNKLNSKKYQSDHLLTIHKMSAYYIETYDYFLIIFLKSVFNYSKTYLNYGNLLVEQSNQLEAIKKRLEDLL